MRLLVTGASGQVGRALHEAARQRHEVVALGHGELAVEDALACERAVARARPDWILHPAAMTDVDACERDPAKAHAVNAVGAGNLAAAAARHGRRMAFVSTDYVFDGEKGAYAETDTPNPLSAYGRSKLEGERLVFAALPEALVARTSVVFGPHKNNFVLWVARSLRAGAPVKVARDQWVTPTLADDAARQLLALVEAGERGIWNTAGGERLSRLEMAQRIARHHGLDPGPIQGVDMASLSWLARRPRDSSLATSKVSRLLRPFSFGEALDRLELAAPGGAGA
jgi:dTDP-4-dehydrorhamnose reductase